MEGPNRREDSAPLKATRALIGHINHCRDCGSISGQELSIYVANRVHCPGSEKGRRKRGYFCLPVFPSFTLTPSVLCYTGTGVHH